MNNQSYNGTLTLNCPTNTGGVNGDPQFVGLHGQSYQIHGIDGAIYAIISERELQMNARFNYVNGPRKCPIMPSTKKPSAACWSHAGSYLTEIGIKTADGGTVRIVAGAPSKGFQSVEINGRMLAEKDEAIVRRVSTHELLVRVGDWTLELENIDEFVNIRSAQLRADRFSSDYRRHGLLGQTVVNKRYNNQLKVIEGEVDDYVIASASIFGDEFLYSRYNQ